MLKIIKIKLLIIIMIFHLQVILVLRKLISYLPKIIINKYFALILKNI